MTDESGNIVSSIRYSVYGEERSREGVKVGERTYTDQIKDDSTNLMYYNARYYNPRLGIFTQPDQIGGIAKYAYAGGNPIRMNDPSGNTEIDPGGAGADPCGDETSNNCPHEQPKVPPISECSPGDGVSSCHSSEKELTNKEIDALFSDPYGYRNLIRNDQMDWERFNAYIKTGLYSRDSRVKQMAHQKAADILWYRGVYIFKAHLEPNEGNSAYNAAGVANKSVADRGIALNPIDSFGLIIENEDITDPQEILYILYHEGVHSFEDRKEFNGPIGNFRNLANMYRLDDEFTYYSAKSEVAAFSQTVDLANNVYLTTGNSVDKFFRDFSSKNAIAFGKIVGKSRDLFEK